MMLYLRMRVDPHKIEDAFNIYIERKLTRLFFNPTPSHSKLTSNFRLATLKSYDDSDPSTPLCSALEPRHSNRLRDPHQDVLKLGSYSWRNI